ncbi:hypothetical protein C0Q70_13746 [Pomacea canaliculata]|uniref:Uncharacterized protein n=1 Tax=Pomacea canaliculata TaxID=400727 RepID=A0A2T7NY21_POMCA|nr:hypothetical protein C0Q70_13746 [Pomacea canaliculata]
MFHEVRPFIACENPACFGRSTFPKQLDVFGVLMSSQLLWSMCVGGGEEEKGERNGFHLVKVLVLIVTMVIKPVVTAVYVVSGIHAFLGLMNLIVGVIASIRAEVWRAHSVSPIWSGGFTSFALRV